MTEEPAMMSIDYPQLRRLLDDGAQLVEVLPAGECAEMHLPGAMSIPLKTLDTAPTAADLDRRFIVSAPQHCPFH